MPLRYDSRQEKYREGFRFYLKNYYSKDNTINSYINHVFYLWNKRGENVFWSAVRADEETLRSVLQETLEVYTPNCAKERYLKDHIRCFNKFREYISNYPDYPQK